MFPEKITVICLILFITTISFCSCNQSSSVRMPDNVRESSDQTSSVSSQLDEASKIAKADSDSSLASDKPVESYEVSYIFIDINNKTYKVEAGDEIDDFKAIYAYSSYLSLETYMNGGKVSEYFEFPEYYCAVKKAYFEGEFEAEGNLIPQTGELVDHLIKFVPDEEFLDRLPRVTETWMDYYFMIDNREGIWDIAEPIHVTAIFQDLELVEMDSERGNMAVMLSYEGEIIGN